MYLVIAEKPSVSQTIAKIIGAYQHKEGCLEGSDCIVSWCLGHLTEFVVPEVYDEKYQNWRFEDLPIIPEPWQLAVAKDKKAQYAILKKLLTRRDMEYVVNACDAGREGELIFQRVYEMTGSKLPVKRLWISSMEDEAVLDGFAHLKDGSEYKNLRQAAICRAKADWLVGLNATRAYTTKCFKKLSVGRVQSPTLSMLVERQQKIEGFQKEKYYTVTLTAENGFVYETERITDYDTAVSVQKNTNGLVPNWEYEEKPVKTVNPPKLYDLTTLQREANRYFGFTAQKTLDIIQTLYENKLVTYPRTDSQYVTEDMKDTICQIVDVLQKKLEHQFVHQPDTARIINNAKVTDHHAIIPTMEIGKRNLDVFSSEEKQILNMIAYRVLEAVSKPHSFLDFKVVVNAANIPFTGKGKQVMETGWKAVDEMFRSKMGLECEKQENSIPDTNHITACRSEVKDHYTSPPKAYTEDTLLSAMETAGNQEFDEDTEKKGLGTPATRAAIIEKLVLSGYATRKGKQILPTKEGQDLIAILPNYLKSASMTAEWENKLLGMERGEVSEQDFMEGILGLITLILNGCRSISETETNRFSDRISLGACPVCGNSVYESKKNYFCADASCSFVLWKDNRYLAGMKKSLDKKMMTDLLTKGSTHCKDFYSSKTGKTFEAELLMKMEDGRAKFSMVFPKK